jgi:hypothetical protein
MFKTHLDKSYYVQFFMFMDGVDETTNIMLNVDKHWCGHIGEGRGGGCLVSSSSFNDHTSPMKC